MKRVTIPAGGIIGAAAIREAVAADYRTIIDLVRDAVRVTLYPNDKHMYLDVTAIYPDSVVIKDRGRQYSFPYTLNESNQVVLESPKEVVTKHEPVRESLVSDQGALIKLIEAVDKDGTKKSSAWLVRVVKSGLSENMNYYSDAALREAVPMFNGARVFVKSDEEHLSGKGKDFNKLIGRLSEATFVDGKRTDTGEIQARFDVLESAGDVAGKIRESVERGMSDLFGFSIDADAVIKNKTIDRKRVREAQKIMKVHSLDLIIEPGAGGEILKLLEAKQTDNHDEDTDMKLRDRMLEAIRKANKGKLPEGLDEANDEQIEAAFREAVAVEIKPADKPKGDDDEAAVSGLTEGQVREAIDKSTRVIEARAEMRVKIAESKLPDASKSRLRKQLESQNDLTIETVTEAIKDERTYLASLTESGSVIDLGDDSIEPGEAQADKTEQMLEALFDPANKEVRSLKECYIAITGDKRVSGQLRDCNMAVMRESLGHVREAISAATFSNVLGDSIARRMQMDYNTQNMYDVWRFIADAVPVNDFRTQERTRMGGYGDLPAVAESDPYAALTSPTDEKATYAVTKRGGTETISLETIKNDDMSVVMRIPSKLARAAKRTLSKFVLDFLKNNTAIYDGDALFHANHANLATIALGPTTLAAGRLQMLKQTELSSADRLGIAARNLLVPTDLEETAFDLFRKQSNNDADFIEAMQMNVLPVWYWDDPNNWYLTADKADVPLIEVGFLDGNEEPELFVQDTPNQGSLFSNDQIVYKIRHIYNGAVKDYRGFQGNIVA